MKNKNNNLQVLWVLVVFLFIGLMLEYSVRQKYQEETEDKLARLQDEINTSANIASNNTMVDLAFERSIMPACFIGGKTH